MASVAVTAINGTLEYIKYSDKYIGKLDIFIFSLLITFVSMLILSFATFGIIGFFNNKRQKQVQKELDEQEEF